MIPRRRNRLIVICSAVIVAVTAAVSMSAAARQTTPPARSAPPTAQPPAAPATLLLDTAKGPIEIELYRDDAPKSVDHILALVRRGFYRGLRFHRVEPSLVQFGDPLTRNMTYRDGWGTGGSGQPIGVAEISKRHLNVRGAVGLAYAGRPVDADSQLYILKTASPSLDGKYAVIGHVTAGMAVVDRLEVADLLKLMSVKGEAVK